MTRVAALETIAPWVFDEHGIEAQWLGDEDDSYSIVSSSSFLVVPSSSAGGGGGVLSDIDHRAAVESTLINASSTLGECLWNAYYNSETTSSFHLPTDVITLLRHHFAFSATIFSESELTQAVLLALSVWRRTHAGYVEKATVINFDASVQCASVLLALFDLVDDLEEDLRCLWSPPLNEGLYEGISFALESIRGVLLNEALIATTSSSSFIVDSFTAFVKGSVSSSVEQQGTAFGAETVIVTIQDHFSDISSLLPPFMQRKAMREVRRLTFDLIVVSVLQKNAALSHLVVRRTCGAPTDGLLFRSQFERDLDSLELFFDDALSAEYEDFDCGDSCSEGVVLLRLLLGVQRTLLRIDEHARQMMAPSPFSQFCCDSLVEELFAHVLVLQNLMVEQLGESSDGSFSICSHMVTDLLWVLDVNSFSKKELRPLLLAAQKELRRETRERNTGDQTNYELAKAVRGIYASRLKNFRKRNARNAAKVASGIVNRIKHNGEKLRINLEESKNNWLSLSAIYGAAVYGADLCLTKCYGRPWISIEKALEDSCSTVVDDDDSCSASTSCSSVSSASAPFDFDEEWSTIAPGLEEEWFD